MMSQDNGVDLPEIGVAIDIGLGENIGSAAAGLIRSNRMVNPASSLAAVDVLNWANR